MQNLKIIKQLSETLTLSETIDAFEYFRLAVEKNKARGQGRQRKVNKKVKELDQLKLFKPKS